jgi:hypothetical protein
VFHPALLHYGGAEIGVGGVENGFFEASQLKSPIDPGRAARGPYNQNW